MIKLVRMEWGNVCRSLSDGVALLLRLADLDLRPLFLASRLYWQRHPTAGPILQNYDYT
jgi:hypothetical protein